MTGKCIESPCVRNCCLDESDVCMGCFRTLTEITCWHDACDAERRKILRNAAVRRTDRNVKKLSADYTD